MSLAPALTEHLYRALSSPLGIVLVCPGGGREKVRMQIYAARRATQDPALECLQIRFGPTNDEEIWIVKGKENDQA
jgi:hypothetical protein